MIKAILFDLDDTLLGNDMNVFLPQYFAWCGPFAQRFMPQDEFMSALFQASRTMVENTDPAVTNNEVFWQRFGEITGVDRQIVESEFDGFYRDEFDRLQEYTQYTPLAAQIMDKCVEQGLQIVIATNPMFPRRAVEARLRWAGVPVTDYDYDLVTVIENMHATKPNAAYYHEILEAINCRPSEALMVGDDWARDIAPAIEVGLFTYWIELPQAELPSGAEPTAQGTLVDLAQRLDEGWLQTLEAAV